VLFCDLLRVDLLDGRVGVEVAANDVRPTLYPVRVEGVEDDLELALANRFVFFRCVGMKVDDAEGPFHAGGIDQQNFEQRLTHSLVQQCVVDRMTNGETGEQRRSLRIAGRVHVIKTQAFRDALNDRQIRRFDKCHHVRPLGFDDLRERVGPALAAVEDVVTDDAHACSAYTLAEYPAAPATLSDTQRKQSQQSLAHVAFAS
jgi:hypothetical protein